MGKIKQIKNNDKKSQNKNSILHRSELKNFVFIIVVVMVIFLLFYGVTVLVKPDEQKPEKEILQETIQYNEILIGQLLNRNEKEYYVLVQENDNVNNALYADYLILYAKKSGVYYTVDLNHAFNQNYIGDSTVVEGQNLSSYHFNDTTLLKVKIKKIDKVYTTYDEIISALKKII